MCATAWGSSAITNRIITKRIAQATLIVDNKIKALETKLSDSSVNIKNTVARVHKEVKDSAESITKEVSSYSADQLLNTANSLLNQYRNKRSK